MDSDKPGFWTRVFRQHKSVFVAILDEIEKAHPRVFDYLMPAFRPGKLDDLQGNPTHWKNVTVVLTSNLGMTDPESDKDQSNRARIEKIFEVTLGGDPDQMTYEVNKALSEIVQQAVKSFLRPEMVNRMTVPTPVFFKWLHPDDAKQLLDQVWIKQLEKDLANQGVKLRFDLKMHTRAKVSTSEQFLHDDLVSNVQDAVRAKDGSLWLLDKEKSQLVLVNSKAPVVIPLGVKGARGITLVESDGVHPSALVLHDEGVLSVNAEGATRPLSGLTGITSFHVTDNSQALFVRDGRAYLAPLSDLTQSKEIKIPEGFQVTEAVRHGNSLYVTDGKDILLASVETPMVIAVSILPKPEENQIHDLQIDPDGRLFYLTEQETEHIEIKDPKNEKETVMEDEIRRMKETKYHLMKGTEEVLVRTVKDDQDVKHKWMYRKESPFEFDENGQPKTADGHPVESRAFREWRGMVSEIEALVESRKQIEKNGARKEDEAEWIGLGKEIKEKSEKMDAKYWVQMPLGFLPDVSSMKFFVRVGSEFEKQYWEWEKDEEAIKKKHDQGVSGKKVKVRSTFLVFRDANGTEIQRKDLEFRKNVLYEEETARIKRETAEKKFGSLAENIRLRRGDAGQIEVVDLSRRTLNQVTTIQFSDLADHLVETSYTDVFAGISSVMKAFEEQVKTPVENKGLGYGQSARISFNRYRNEKGTSRGSIRIEDVRQEEEVAPTSLMPRVGKKARNARETNAIRAVDRLLEDAYKSGRDITQDDLMRAFEESSEVNVEETIAALEEKDPYYEHGRVFDGSKLINGGEISEEKDDDPSEFHQTLARQELPEEAHQAFEHSMNGLYRVAVDQIKGRILSDRGVAKPASQITDADLDRSTGKPLTTVMNRELFSNPAYRITQRWGWLNEKSRQGIAGEIAFDGYISPEERLAIHKLIHLPIDDEQSWQKFNNDPS
ncbi:MAG: AAA family ATPase, partial [Lentisphaerota bacterium]